MKILLISFEYPPETGFGGIGTYTWYQARGLTKIGHEVHVLAGSVNPTNLKSTDDEGIQVYRFKSRNLLMRGLEILNKSRLFWSKIRLENALNMYGALRKLLRHNKYDLVEMPECGAEGSLINNLIRLKTLIRFHSPARLIMPYYEVPRLDIHLCSLIEQLAIFRATAYTSCSRFLAKEVRSKLNVKKPVEVIPNGIDLELFDGFDRLNVLRKYKLPEDRPIIMFSGRMERRKGIHLCKEIISSVAEQYEVAFVFAGQDIFNYVSNTLNPFLKTKQLKGSFHYLGKLNLLEVRSLLHQASIYFIPSLWENCPYACLEAMASSCAIVSTDQGGMPELIQDNENGLLARNEDATSFAEKIKKLIDNHELRICLGNAARKTVEASYTDIHIAELSSRYYSEIV